MRRTRIPNFIPFEQCERGEKLGEPKTGENKILVLDAKYAYFKQSPYVILAKFWHAVFSIVFLLMRFLHIHSCGLFDGHKYTNPRLNRKAPWRTGYRKVRKVISLFIDLLSIKKN